MNSISELSQSTRFLQHHHILLVVKLAKMLFFRFVRPQNQLQNHISSQVSTYSFFKTLVDSEVTVELKNDIQIKGILKSVDQYLNIKLDDIQVVEELKYPHLVSIEPGRKQWDGRRWALYFEFCCADDARIVFGQECFHKRKCCQIRTFAWWRG